MAVKPNLLYSNVECSHSYLVSSFHAVSIIIFNKNARFSFLQKLVFSRNVNDPIKKIRELVLPNQHKLIELVELKLYQEDCLRVGKATKKGT